MLALFCSHGDGRTQETIGTVDHGGEQLVCRSLCDDSVLLLRAELPMGAGDRDGDRDHRPFLLAFGAGEYSLEHCEGTL